MNISMRSTVLYVRISKDDEHIGDSDSITNQLSILMRYAEEHGYTNIKVFKDDGYTGTNFDRPGFQKMFSLVKSGQVERIIVKDLSRLGRNYIETGRYIDVEFPRYNVQFIAINEGFDSNGGDIFLSAILNLINEFYAMDISRKQKASLKARSLRGDHITSKIPFGYMRDPDKKNHWLIDELAAKAVKKIFEMYIAGDKIKDICKHLSDNKFLSPSNYSNNKMKNSRAYSNPYYWCTSSIIDIVDRQEYCGDTVNFKTYHINHKDKHIKKRDRKDYVIIENTQEPIITREQFELAQQRRSSSKRAVTERVTHLLDGLVYCAECKQRLYVNKKTSKKIGDYYVYMCNNYKKNKRCTAHYITEDKLIHIVKENTEILMNKFHELGNVEFRRFVSKVITDRTAENVKLVKVKMEMITKRLDEISTTEKELYMDKINGVINIETFNRITYSLNKEAAELDDEQGQLAMLLNKVEDTRMGIDSFVGKVAMYSDVDIEDNLELIINQIISSVNVSERIEENDSKITVSIRYDGVGILF